jgi:ankyrin repeat protein
VVLDRVKILDRHLAAGLLDGDPSLSGPALFPPLHNAAKHRSWPVVKQLLGKVPIDARDSFERTALHYAAADGNDFLVVKLLEASASCDAADLQGRTPLHLAALSGSRPAARSLLTYAARRERRAALALLAAGDFQKKTALHLAAQQGHKDVVEELRGRGADPNVRDRNNKRPFDLAPTRNREDLRPFLEVR